MFHLCPGQNVLWLHKKLLHIFHTLFHIFFFFAIIIFVVEWGALRAFIVNSFDVFEVEQNLRGNTFSCSCAASFWASRRQSLLFAFVKVLATFFFLFRSVPFSSHFNLVYSVYIFPAQNFEFFMYEIVFRQNPYALICCLWNAPKKRPTTNFSFVFS